MGCTLLLEIFRHSTSLAVYHIMEQCKNTRTECWLNEWAVAEQFTANQYGRARQRKGVSLSLLCLTAPFLDKARRVRMPNNNPPACMPGHNSNDD
jgi:hypothetical protein